MMCEHNIALGGLGGCAPCNDRLDTMRQEYHSGTFSVMYGDCNMGSGLTYREARLLAHNCNNSRYANNGPRHWDYYIVKEN